MSLIVTVCTSEGIVLASDSRSTLTKTLPLENKEIIQYGAHYSDTAYKTFQCGKSIGISTCGNANIMGKSIASHIENFINNCFAEEDSVSDVSSKLLLYFSTLQHAEPVVFHVAGYEKECDRDIPKVYRVVTNLGLNDLVVDNFCGVRWDGEASVLTRIIKNGYIVEEDTVRRLTSLTVTSEEGESTELENVIVLPQGALHSEEAEIAWEYMTVQDGIDFAKYAIQTTIDTMRFQVAAKTVGGPVDILVVKPDKTIWIAHKELHY